MRKKTFPGGSGFAPAEGSPDGAELRGSCTGGLLAQLVTSVPGSSGEFLGGIVTYTNGMKHKLLGIPLAQLEERELQARSASRQRL